MIKFFNSEEEISTIISSVSCLKQHEAEKFVSIMQRKYHVLIEEENNYIGCYFCKDNIINNKNSSIIYQYRVISYDVEKIINDKKYRISFDSFGILLFKLFIAYVSGGISATVFMSLESIVEYFVTSNVSLDNIQTCILYTILLDKKCRKGYFDARYLYNKYYKNLKSNNDTCMLNLNEIKCLYNEYNNKCTISKKRINDILNRLERKKILCCNEIGKYYLK